MFFDDINQINNARVQQYPQQQTTNIRKKLTEQKISPDDLIEFDAEQYNEMKNQGLSIEKMKETIFHFG